MRTIILIAITAALIAACGPGPTQNTASSAAARVFYVGLAALQVGDYPRAEAELTKLTQIAANEPAGWANLGILQMRQKDFDGSGRSLDRARALSDKNAKIYETIALLEKQRGNFDASQGNLQKAIDLEPGNLKAIYTLAKEKERAVDAAAARELYDRILAIRPNNLEARLEAIRLAAKQNDPEALRNNLSSIKPPTPAWEAEAQQQFDALKTAAASSDMQAALTQASYFRNTLLRDARFRDSVDEIRFSDTSVGEPFTKPLVLQVPGSSPAPADSALKFEPQPQNERPARWSRFVYLNGDPKPVLASGDHETTRLGERALPFAVSSGNGLAVIDFDYDFKNDIALAGGKGFHLFHQDETGFTDVTDATKLPRIVLDGKYAGVWTLDVESDGDLDLMLGGLTGSPVILQNNSDGTFSRIDPFSSISEAAIQFIAADLDEDGDADAVILGGENTLHFFTNDRGGLFRKRDIPAELSKVEGFDVADVDRDGKLELITITADGSAKFLADENGSGWKVAELFKGDAGAPLVQDVDNNGAVDVIVAGTTSSRIWLADPDRGFTALDPTAMSLTSFADVDGDGRMDASAISGGQAVTVLNRGSRNYNWQDVRPRAAKTSGDQRVNSFGIGGELELRAGLSVQKRLITEPVVHFGLGENAAADVLRVLWQNGSVQAEFDLKPNQTIAAEQRLKGSCPHLFAFDGESFKHVKDAPPWSPALGLKINAQDTFGIIETEEWFKVPGTSLRPTMENFYELRITAEYWETYYLDQYSLLVVDHPENTEVFTDERFSVPPPPLEVVTTGATHEFASVRGNKGQDASSIVKTIDEMYLDDFDRGTFQGVAKDHFVELELPADAPSDKRLAIIADGWMHPTDASINVQMGQSSLEKPKSLTLEVRDADGAWKVANESMGFPAGKMKTMTIELPIGTRAARLRTNMEIFWDKLAWAVYEDGVRNKTMRLELTATELRHRGFSVIEKKDDSSPEVPQYDRLLTTGQRWRDMEGYFTRYGDVLDLLTQSDDRFVLMNGGDEIVLKFAALPPPAAGYKRDFVLIGDGWIKDGDLNSVFSKTVLPLPTHATNDYSRPPTTLAADPVYQKHKADWVSFHTRYVAPDRFRRAMR